MDLVAFLRERTRRRRAYAELLQLDDHLLRDMGVTRAEVRAMRWGRKPDRAL